MKSPVDPIARIREIAKLHPFQANVGELGVEVFALAPALVKAIDAMTPSAPAPPRALHTIAEAKVGETVWLRDVNENHPSGPGRKQVRIVKVGRSLIHIEGDTGGYDRKTGRRRDRYEHAWLQTDDEEGDERERLDAVRWLRAIGIEFSFGSKLSKHAARVCEALRPIVAELGA